MSAIDSYNHSHVGTFLGISLYHPLESLITDDGFELNNNYYEKAIERIEKKNDRLL